MFIIGQVISFAGDFVPKGFAKCDGKMLNIIEHPELYAILGTTYGGNGQTTFALPDCRGRVVLGAGQGLTLSNYQLGQKVGSESIALSEGEMPKHSHKVNAVSTHGTSNSPTGKLLSNTGAFDSEYSSDSPDVEMNTSMVAKTGSSNPHENRQPSIALNCLICVCGDYPFRSGCVAIV